MTTFWDLQLCTLVSGWFKHFKGPKNASCLWFGRFSYCVKCCRHAYEKFHSDINQFEHFEKLKIKTISNKEEEAKIKKEEEELELAETAFDTFLQEKDRLSMEAQKKWSYD